MPNFNDEFKKRIQTTRQMFIKDVVNWLNNQTEIDKTTIPTLLEALKQTQPDEILAKVADFPLTRHDWASLKVGKTYFTHSYECQATAKPYWRKVCDILNIVDRLLLIENLLVKPSSCDLNLETHQLVIRCALNAASELNLPGHSGDFGEHYQGRYQKLTNDLTMANTFNSNIIQTWQDDHTTNGQDFEFILDDLISKRLPDCYNREKHEGYTAYIWFSAWQTLWENLCKNLFDQSLYRGSVSGREQVIKQLKSAYISNQMSPVNEAIKEHNHYAQQARNALSLFDKGLKAKYSRFDSDNQLIAHRSYRSPLQLFSSVKFYSLFTQPSQPHVLSTHPLLQILSANNQSRALTYESQQGGEGQPAPNQSYQQ
ncbi:hypothetical protein [Legionella sp. W05-934-2]|uniref:hypothetical protein n=1 Tax=Legionella sp. W05-934-2 TaxID=1198649 RepID=UPI0034637AAC